MKPKPSYFDRDPSRAPPSPQRMREILDSRTKGGDAIEPDAGPRHVAAGAASAENTPMGDGETIPPAGCLRSPGDPPSSLQEQQDMLGALTFAPPLPMGPERPAPAMKPIETKPLLPQGYVPARAELEWQRPVVYANGEGTLISTGGQYEVLKRFTRTGGYGYTALHGLNVLVGPRATAEEAKRDCQEHYRRSCGESADNGTG